jgi:hypothetical protein
LAIDDYFCVQILELHPVHAVCQVDELVKAKKAGIKEAAVAAPVPALSAAVREGAAQRLLALILDLSSPSKVCDLTSQILIGWFLMFFFLKIYIYFHFQGEASMDWVKTMLEFVESLMTLPAKSEASFGYLVAPLSSEIVDLRKKALVVLQKLEKLSGTEQKGKTPSLTQPQIKAFALMFEYLLLIQIVQPTSSHVGVLNDLMEVINKMTTVTPKTPSKTPSKKAKEPESECAIFKSSFFVVCVLNTTFFLFVFTGLVQTIDVLTEILLSLLLDSSLVLRRIVSIVFNAFADNMTVSTIGLVTDVLTRSQQEEAQLFGLDGTDEDDEDEDEMDHDHDEDEDEDEEEEEEDDEDEDEDEDEEDEEDEDEESDDEPANGKNDAKVAAVVTESASDDDDDDSPVEDDVSHFFHSLTN